MYRAEASGSAILRYDNVHRCVWTALADAHRPRLAEAVLQIGRESTSPLIQATAATALMALGAADPSWLPDRIKAVVKAGRDPFAIFGPDVTRLNDGRPVELAKMVRTIVLAPDPSEAAALIEKLLAAVRPAHGVAAAPGYIAAAVVVNFFYPAKYLNIGGGSSFVHPFWCNLDEVCHPCGGLQLKLSPEFVVPFADGSVDCAYSSHCLEHLDDPTVERVLSEIRRVLRPDGRFVLKLPDFDSIIHNLQQKKADYFQDPAWFFSDVVWSWDTRQIADTLENRFVYLLCGYWNQAWTEAAGGTVGNAIKLGAYNGPPRVAADEVWERTRTSTPHEIAAWLCERALSEAPDAHFNHRNAWSADELCQLLERHGLTPSRLSDETAVQRHEAIPDIGKYAHLSIYLEGVPNGSAHTERSVVEPAQTDRYWDVVPGTNRSAWFPADVADVKPRRYQPGLHQLHAVLWAYHDLAVRQSWANMPESDFSKHGFVSGQTPDRYVSEMEEIFRGEFYRTAISDFRADGIHERLTPSELAALTEHVRYVAPTESQRETIVEFLKELKPLISEQIQSAWRVTNIRCYETDVTFEGGPQDWHSDRLPQSLIKLLIYLSKDEVAVRGSELIDRQGEHVRISGPSGRWLLFDSTDLLHRAPSEGEGPRQIIEVLLCRDFDFDIEFRFGGTNYRAPLCPPSINPFDGVDPENLSPLMKAVMVAARQITELRWQLSVLKDSNN
ncbi:class I SAM-dependent methyltransferase [Marinibaculum pumilum]|uniref:Class I SAM-dependent methyltransferase n=1 Tax=Marinibaculum pumilum TaxID=1766165 RepID=A0ABV7KU96_9PROT